MPELFITLNSMSCVEDPKSVVDVSVYLAEDESHIAITVPVLLLFEPPPLPKT